MVRSDSATASSELQQSKIVSSAKGRSGMLPLPMVETDDKLKALAARVKAGMMRAGLGVGDVAKALKVTPEMARRYREGLAMPKPDKLAKLARLLGMSPAELLFGPSAGSKDGVMAMIAELSVEEQALIDTYRQLPEFGKKALRARAAELLEHFGAPSKKNPFGKGGTQ